jgi:hypothetical protein
MLCPTASSEVATNGIRMGFKTDTLIAIFLKVREGFGIKDLLPAGRGTSPENRTGVSGPRDLELSLSFSRPQEPSPPSGGLGA